MQRYLVLSHGNFYAKKQDSNKVLPFGARGSGNYASPCILTVLCVFIVNLFSKQLLAARILSEILSSFRVCI